MGGAAYENPLITRYAGSEMSELFSSDVKFSTWRKLWTALAEAEMELGLPITKDQVEELRAHTRDINYDEADAKEKEIRHDVMAHVYAYGLQCPKAKPIIHLGATSAFVGDNADLIIMRGALELLKGSLARLLYHLSEFALEYKDLPTLGFTHFQAAQLTTVGKRAALWMQDFYFDYTQVDKMIRTLPMRGVKGTTGTQASFMDLFNGDEEKVKQLDRSVCEKMGFQESIPLSGQTYTRKIDYSIMSLLSGIAQSVSKMTNDIRLLCHLKEVEEPFEKSQVGSSAMAYKRNPMRSERAASIARFVISLADNAAYTASTQWFERTLDDSANRRITLPQAFLGADACLRICDNISSGLVVHPRVIRKHIDEEMPFMATENILMEAVKRGGDRQELHEKIRVLSHEASKLVKDDGKDNPLLSLIAKDPAFGLQENELEALLMPEKYIGRAPSQTEEFVVAYLAPIFEEYRDLLNEEAMLNV
jgi:adenylosuccinate lyase